MANPDSHDKWTCPSTTTKKTRCLKTRSAAVMIEAKFLLDKMSLKTPATFLEDEAALTELAKVSMCTGWHLNKFQTVGGKSVSFVSLAVADWQRKISAHIQATNERIAQYPPPAYSFAKGKGLFEPASGGRVTPETFMLYTGPPHNAGRKDTGRRAPSTSTFIKDEDDEDFSRTQGTSSPSGSSSPPRHRRAPTKVEEPRREDGGSDVLRQAMEQLTLQLEREKRDKAELEKSGREKQAMLDKLQDELKAEQNEKELCDNEIESLYEKIKRLKIERDQLRDENTHLKSRVGSLELASRDGSSRSGSVRSGAPAAGARGQNPSAPRVMDTRTPQGLFGATWAPSSQIRFG